jgi:hypothetical protein
MPPHKNFQKTCTLPIFVRQGAVICAFVQVFDQRSGLGRSKVTMEFTEISINAIKIITYDIPEFAY